MTNYFFDSSAAVKKYHLESGTSEVLSIFGEADGQITISMLAYLELHSAFSIKVRSGVINTAQADILRIRFLLDVDEGKISVVKLLSRRYSDALRLLRRYAYKERLRTLDAIQLAVALDLRSKRQIDYFVAADLALIEVAKLEGLVTMVPNS